MKYKSLDPTILINRYYEERDLPDCEKMLTTIDKMGNSLDETEAALMKALEILGEIEDFAKRLEEAQKMDGAIGGGG